MLKAYKKIAKGLAVILSLSIFTFESFAAFHEVELHSSKALISFSDETSIDLKGNYLMFLDNDWQILFGAEYDKQADLITRTGLTIGGVYNFGAPDHNEKYYVKPQLTYASADVFGNGSESTVYVTSVVGKRFPIFKNDYYTINYTPSVGISVPLSNTDAFDTVFTVSVVGLSLVFK